MSRLILAPLLFQYAVAVAEAASQPCNLMCDLTSSAVFCVLLFGLPTGEPERNMRISSSERR